MLYRDAGVNIDALNLIRKSIGKQVARTFDSKRKSVFGLFGGIYLYENEYLISSVDSVGTKILVACGAGIHSTIGQDIVNHCVNDILTTGATPMFFMDYIGFSEIEKNVLVEIVQGLVTACRKEKIVLIGGETAQLSRFYPKGVYDLVGFVVGRVKKNRLIDPRQIQAGDLLLGFASSGLHTNGYSLARKVLLRKYTFSTHIPELKCTIGEELLKVHVCYRKKIEPVLPYIRALAHITGGGFYDNIIRVLPRNCAAVINKKSWTPLPVFRLIQRLGQVPEDEMYHVFNMGIGMVAVVDPKNFKYFKSLKPKIIGEIVKGKSSVTLK